MSPERSPGHARLSGESDHAPQWSVNRASPGRSDGRFHAKRSSAEAPIPDAGERSVANPIARSKATDNTKAIAGRMRAFRAFRDWIG
jgi:hypothetical protein